MGIRTTKNTCGGGDSIFTPVVVWVPAPVRASRALVPSTRETSKNYQYIDNLIYDNTTETSITSATPVGTLAQDPLFVNYKPDGCGDYHLQSVSPAIDYASTTNAPPIDFDGSPRPDNGESRVDVGAYEYQDMP